MDKWTRGLVWGLFAMTATMAMAAPPEFDAVVIKPAPAGGRGGGYNITGDRIHVINQTLKDMVKFGWDLQEYQLSGITGGAGAWMTSDHFDIVATTPGGANDEQRRTMMQEMLRTRFAVAVHKESKEVSGFALVVGKNGSKLKAPSMDDGELMMGRNAAGLRTLNGVGHTTAGLASILATLLARPVADKTGLSGQFDFHMEWVPDVGQVELREGAAPPPDGGTGPSIYTAVQESLGLKLETMRSTVEVVVLDHAEKPTEN